MMKHPSEEELIGYREGEPFATKQEREKVKVHLAECAECRAELERIEAALAMFAAMPVPDPGADYGARVWQRIAPRLGERPARWWEFSKQDWRSWFAPRRLAAAGAMAALVLAAFLAGRWMGPRKGSGTAGEAPIDAAQVRERVLVVAVGEHLGKSEMVLMELANAPQAASGKTINIASEQRRAEDLVETNRLYRQTALQSGDRALASTLDELERVLLDVANSPDEVTPAQFEAIRQRIESRGILFKVRVVGKELQRKQTEGSTSEKNSKSKEGNKA